MYLLGLDIEWTYGYRWAKDSFAAIVCCVVIYTSSTTKIKIWLAAKVFISYTIASNMP